VPGAREAIEKSYRWLFGVNELETPMMLNSPSGFTAPSAGTSRSNGPAVFFAALGCRF